MLVISFLYCLIAFVFLIFAFPFNAAHQGFQNKIVRKNDQFCTAQRHINNRVVLPKVTAFVWLPQFTPVGLSISHAGKKQYNIIIITKECRFWYFSIRGWEKVRCVNPALWQSVKHCLMLSRELGFLTWGARKACKGYVSMAASYCRQV